MRNSHLVSLAAVISTLGIQGCAHSTLDKKIDSEVSQETAIQTQAELRAETNQVIQSAPGLSSDQRARLAALRDSTRAQIDQLRSQSLKLRSVLIKDLITTNYNEEEVELIKTRISNLEDKRLLITFNAIEQASQILGGNAPDNRRVMEELWEGHGNRD